MRRLADAALSDAQVPKEDQQEEIRVASKGREVIDLNKSLNALPTPASTDHTSTTPLMAANTTFLNFQVVALGSSRASLIFSTSACTLSDSPSGTDKPSSVRVRPLATPDKVSKCNIVEARTSSGSINVC